MPRVITSSLLLFWSFACHGQQTGGKVPVPRKNVVKVDVSSLLFRNFSAQYERAIAPGISVAAQTRLMPIGELLGWNSSSEHRINNWTVRAKASSLSLTPEIRFYAKRVLRGFYAAPYLRFRRIEIQTEGMRTATPSPMSFSASGRLNTLSGGLMMGAHYQIGRFVSLDWFIFGYHIAKHFGKASATYSGPPLTAPVRAGLRDQINKYSSGILAEELGGGSKVESFLSFLNAGPKFPYEIYGPQDNLGLYFRSGAAGFRGFGLNLGYRF